LGWPRAGLFWVESTRWVEVCAGRVPKKGRATWGLDGWVGGSGGCSRTARPAEHNSRDRTPAPRARRAIVRRDVGNNGRTKRRDKIRHLFANLELPEIPSSPSRALLGPEKDEKYLGNGATTHPDGRSSRRLFTDRKRVVSNIMVNRTADTSGNYIC